MSRVAIIPARGGSKRIPHKNIRLFAGKPIIGYSIDAAKASGMFDRIIVSTDDPDIAAVAETFGAEVPFIRPEELSNDFTGTSAVVKHALLWLEAHDFPVEYACCIYATAPFIQVEDLCHCFQLLVDSRKEFAFPVTTFPFPVQRALRLNRDGFVEAIWPENIMVRSQDLEEAYHDAGQFYWGRTGAFIDDVMIYSSASVPLVIPRYRVQDIDTPDDWLRAELMFDMLTTMGHTETKVSE